MAPIPAVLAKGEVPVDGEQGRPYTPPETWMKKSIIFYLLPSRPEWSFRGRNDYPSTESARNVDGVAILPLLSIQEGGAWMKWRIIHKMSVFRGRGGRAVNVTWCRGMMQFAAMGSVSRGDSGTAPGNRRLRRLRSGRCEGLCGNLCE